MRGRRERLREGGRGRLRLARKKNSCLSVVSVQNNDITEADNKMFCFSQMVPV